MRKGNTGKMTNQTVENLAVLQSEADAIIGKIQMAYSAIEHADAESNLLAEAAAVLEVAIQKAYAYRDTLK